MRKIVFIVLGSLLSLTPFHSFAQDTHTETTQDAQGNIDAVSVDSAGNAGVAGTNEGVNYEGNADAQGNYEVTGTATDESGTTHTVTETGNLNNPE